MGVMGAVTKFHLGCQDPEVVSHQGMTFPSQSRKAPVSFSEREERTFSIPCTLSSTVVGGCGAEEQMKPMPEALIQPRQGEGGTPGQRGNLKTLSP